jgi:hypothetical protein
MVTEQVAQAEPDESQQLFAKRMKEERRNYRLLAAREVFDRIGYGGATPQFVNILFWIGQQANPFIFFIIGVLNGVKTVLSVFWSGILQEYSKLHRVSKNMIAKAGIIFGFSFLFMGFGLLLHSTVMFSIAFLAGTIGIVAYGDLYLRFSRDTIRKERSGWFLRTLAHWGIVITALALLLSGLLLDTFPISGTLWEFTLLGHSFSLNVYGYVLTFEVTAFAFILSGFITSLISDNREERQYQFGQFFKEYVNIISLRLKTVWSNKYVKFLLLAAVISGILQLSITAYSGIAIYRLLAEHYDKPFVPLAMIYAIAIIASFSGPFFTERIHRSTGLSPTLVFGTLLMAILPLVLVYNDHIAAITVAMCLYVIGAAIVGFGQGMLAQNLMDDEMRRSYFQVQSVLVLLPYLLLIPVMAWIANALPLSTLFVITAIGLVGVVMPIYFLLVVVSQKVKL